MRLILTQEKDNKMYNNRVTFILKIIIILILFTTTFSFSQFNLEWTSPNQPTNVNMGWVTWFTFNQSFPLSNRFYIKYEDKIDFMFEGAHNLTPEYTYIYSDAEKQAGSLLTCLYYDFNSDNFPEFKITKRYGSYPYREAFRILDLKTNLNIIDFDNSTSSYDYYTISDIDNDGTIELVVRKEPYPSTGNYELLVYNTGINLAMNNLCDDNIKVNNFLLNQNYPNPFNQSTKMQFLISQNANVKLVIYDIQGRIVKTLVNEWLLTGSYEKDWNGQNEFGLQVSSGTYFYKLYIDGRQITKKMIILK